MLVLNYEDTIILLQLVKGFLIDFTKPSHMERLFVIDLVAERILFRSLVAHGKNSGEDYATSFSNNPNSHQSSLGYYLTGKPYVGRHGYSLLLDGLEKGINDNARNRAVKDFLEDYNDYFFHRNSTFFFINMFWVSVV